MAVNSEGDARSFLRQVVGKVGAAFHIDTPFLDYTKDGEPLWSPGGANSDDINLGLCHDFVDVQAETDKIAKRDLGVERPPTRAEEEATEQVVADAVSPVSTQLERERAGSHLSLSPDAEKEAASAVADAIAPALGDTIREAYAKACDVCAEYIEKGGTAEGLRELAKEAREM